VEALLDTARAGTVDGLLNVLLGVFGPKLRVRVTVDGQDTAIPNDAIIPILWILVDTQTHTFITFDLDGPDYYRIVVAPNEHERGEDWVDVTEKACADDWLAAAAHALRAGGQEIRVRISGPRAEVTLRWPRSYGRP
jgi:hypothetical protein